jgi:hypothetical protein
MYVKLIRNQFRKLLQIKHLSLSLFAKIFGLGKEGVQAPSGNGDAPELVRTGTFRVIASGASHGEIGSQLRGQRARGRIANESSSIHVISSLR